MHTYDARSYSHWYSHVHTGILCESMDRQVPGRSLGPEGLKVTPRPQMQLCGKRILVLDWAFSQRHFQKYSWQVLHPPNRTKGAAGPPSWYGEVGHRTNRVPCLLLGLVFDAVHDLVLHARRLLLDLVFDAVHDLVLHARRLLLRVRGWYG